MYKLENTQNRKKYIQLELPNAISHGIGVLLGVFFLLLLILPKINSSDKLGLVAYSIYGGSFIFLFLASCLKDS